MSIDKIAEYNRERWNELARERITFSRPALDLDEASAKALLDPGNNVGDVRGKDVLCLASGGGQQSAAFGILGANVTVLDLSDVQLERDAIAAAHYGLDIDTRRGDMRDLSAFADNSFDIVWHPHSIKFVPEVNSVFREVARVIRDRGIYKLDCPNPYIVGIDERDWNGEGYPLKYPYIDGVEVVGLDTRWEVWDDNGNCTMIEGPKEFRHTLETLINGVIDNGFTIFRLDEVVSENPDAAPGTWDHFTSIIPPGFSLWCRYNDQVVATG